MAERLISVLIRCLSALILFATLSGCVSTEELYAPYDAVNCKVVIEKNETGDLTLRELISDTYFPWEPAVYFDFNSHVLDADNSELLTVAVEVLTRYPQLNLSLRGFADRVGTVYYNHELADRRVQAVIRHLVAAGIDPTRLADLPLGEGLDQFGADDSVSRSINRRVELMLLDEEGRPVNPVYNLDGL